MSGVRQLICALVAVAAVLLSTLTGWCAEELSVPLEIFQARRNGVKGTAFTDEYVRVGLPFPRGLVREAAGGRALLGVSGAPYQTRVLKRWPDGSVQWALVELLASVPAGKGTTVRVNAGPGKSDGADLATERDGAVLVNTGPLHVEMRAKGFSIFERVVVDGREIVARGASRGIVLLDDNGKEFTAASDRGTQLRIEENGPIRSVVRIDGSHVNDGKRLLDYTLRLFFTQGKRQVMAQYTLRNASKDDVRDIRIREMRLELSLMASPHTAQVATHGGQRHLDMKNGAVTLYQAVSDFPWLSDGDSFYHNGPVAPDYAREKDKGYSQEGYWLKQGGLTVMSGNRHEFPDVSYLDLHDADGVGLSTSIRYMAGNWPKAMRGVVGERLSVALWPEENGAGYWVRYGSHNSAEVLFSFHKGEDDTGAHANRFQYPLVARGPIEWYNRATDGFYPLYHFVSFSDEAKLARKVGADYVVGFRKPAFKVWRYHYWAHGAFLNQHDFGRIALVNFLREDRDLAKAGEYYLQGENIAGYNADWSVWRTDGYDYARQQLQPREKIEKAQLAKVQFDFEHSHWYGMALWYYMTGDERVREAILDFGEYQRKKAENLSLIYMRIFGMGMFNLAALYEFTGDGSYLTLADRNFERLLAAKYNPQEPWRTIFIDWQRGYVAGGSGSGWPGVKADLMMGSILYDGILNYYLHGREGRLRNEARRLLLAMSEFMLREPYFEGTKRGRWAYWIPYVYDLEDRNKSDHSYRLIGQATFWTVLPYEETGEERWLAQMRTMLRMALWDEAGVWGSYGFMDHPGFQTMGYYVLNPLSKEQARPHAAVSAPADEPAGRASRKLSASLLALGCAAAGGIVFGLVRSNRRRSAALPNRGTYAVSKENR
ncbi:MAG: hypothetical protein FD174_160 [Geobacteraceae bacterium]|nr:MAG: hypothetical protein FD174_160 [Geobacteraceae bacterium]